MDEIKNIKKISEDMYEYDLVRTTLNQTNLDALNREKEELSKRVAAIDYLLSEIEKLKAEKT